MPTVKKQWEFGDDEMADTPSIQQGFCMKKEADLRLRACRIIERVGKKLGMPQDQINMGKILLHRFYMRYSLQQGEYHEVAATILFIASKLGSGAISIKIEKIILYCAKDAKKDGPVDMNENNKEFRYWWNAIFGLEEIILHRLCYDDTPALPHPKAIALVKDFNAVRYSPEMIAYAAIYAACESSGEELKTPHGTLWWQAKRLDESCLKVLAMEIVMAAESRFTCLVIDKVIQKLGIRNATNTSPQVPGTPFTSSSVLSTSPDASIGGYKYKTEKPKERHHPYQKPVHTRNF